MLDKWEVVFRPKVRRSDRYVPTLLDRVAGTGILCLALLPIVAERSTAFLLPLFTLVLLSVARAEGRHFALNVANPVTAIALTLCYAALSGLWALGPVDAATHVGVALIMVIAAQVSISWIDAQDQNRLNFLGFWLVIGFCLGVAYLVLEVASMQGIRRFVVNTISRSILPDKVYTFDAEGKAWIKAYELNRNVAVVNLLLWPTLLCAWTQITPKYRSFVIAFLFAAAFFATFVSKHETSKIALLVASLAFVMAQFIPKIAVRATILGFVALSLLIVPLSIFAHKTLQLHEASWLQFSAKERIKIWGSIAQEVFESPVFGVGVRSTYATNLQQQQASEPMSSGRKTATVPPHAHNAYLQAWYELGAIGAIGFLIAGLLLIRGVGALGPPALPFALAGFTTGAIELAASWEIWQRWFFAMLAISGVCTVLAVRTKSESAPTQPGKVKT